VWPVLWSLFTEHATLVCSAWYCFCTEMGKQCELATFYAGAAIPITAWLALTADAHQEL
jgi:hypothetical protein